MIKIQFTAKTKDAEFHFMKWSQSQSKKNMPTRIISLTPCILEVRHILRRAEKILYKNPRTKQIFLLTIRDAYEQIVRKEGLTPLDYEVVVKDE